MTPVGNHYEQEMNAALFSKAGAGLISLSFDVNSIFPFIEKYQVNEDFKNWLLTWDIVFEDVLSRILWKKENPADQRKQ
jgi:hypothetical protein